jgi:hypothetical protein
VGAIFGRPRSSKPNAPPWTTIRLHTDQPAAESQPSYLEIIDLANLENLDTVAAIRTQDIAIAKGEREFILLGRDPEAVARGCSRVIG